LLGIKVEWVGSWSKYRRASFQHSSPEHSFSLHSLIFCQYSDRYTKEEEADLDTYRKTLIMRSSTIIALGFTTLAAARQTYPRSRLEARAEANLPTIKATIQAIDRDAGVLDASIVALTAANAATQLDVINKNLLTMAADVSAQAKKIGASGAVGIGEAAGLLSSKNQAEWTTLATKVNTTVFSTYNHIIEKKDIVKASGKVDKIVPGIKAQKQGILDMVAIVPGQIPSSLKGMLNNLGKSAGGSSGGASAPKLPSLDELTGPAGQQKIGQVVDDLLDQVIAVLKGTQETFTMPAGINLGGIALPTGSGSAPAAASAAPSAAPKATTPKAAAPKATSSPKATTSSKGVPKGKGAAASR
jgi:hypothetical protein